MFIEIKLNVGTIVLLGVIGGLYLAINKKNAKINKLTKENEELKSAINAA